MSTCDSVDLPDPFGPISACTSPDATSRSTPRRISTPATDACRFEIRSDAHGHLHHHVVAVDPHGVDGHRSGRRQGLGLAGRERERRAVLRALDLALVGPDVALGERVVGVRALVADHVPVVAEVHRAEPVTVDVEPRAGRRPASTSLAPRTAAGAVAHVARASVEVADLLVHRAPQRRRERGDGQAGEHVLEEAEHDQPLGVLGPHAAGLEVVALVVVDRTRPSTRASTARRRPRSRGSGSTPRRRPR